MTQDNFVHRINLSGLKHQIVQNNSGKLVKYGNKICEQNGLNWLQMVQFEYPKH